MEVRMATKQHKAFSADVEEARKLFDHASARLEKLTGPAPRTRVALFPRGIDFISVKVAVGTVTVEFAVAGPDARKPPTAEAAKLTEGAA
jgi:hypothetical protein